MATSSVTTNKTGITATQESYDLISPLWRNIRAILFGKARVVELKGGLPMPDYTDTVRGTTTPDWDKRNKRLSVYLQRGQLLNATARTQASNTGMIWSSEPVDTIPPGMDWVRETLRDDVQKVVGDVVSIGRYGVLLDSDGAESVTGGEQQEQGVGLPQWILYKAEQIIFARDNDIRLLETYEEQDGLDYKVKQQVRRLTLIDNAYHNQVYRKDELHTDVVPTVNKVPLDYIPFQFFGSEENSNEITKPPIYDLAEANLGHFMLDCDNRDNLHAHGQGLTNIFVDDGEVFGTANPNGLNTGAKGVNQFGKDDRVEIVQIEATGAIAAEMLRDQERMIMTGAQLVQDTSGNQTLGAKKMEFGASISTLKQATMNVSKGVTQLLNWQAEMTGNTPNITYTLNTTFITDALTPEMLIAHMQLVQMGVLPASTLYESARKAELTTLEDEEIKQLASEESFKVVGTSAEEAARLAANEG